jgi:hypothetical protein
MNTHSSDVCTSFTTDPENSKVLFLIELEQLAFIDSSDSEFSLDGSNSG